ncbi:hypothetical protein CQW23_06242 [Capsicum baccatum]|uniref:Zinc finger PMZ-type domain-containing protein n=1 Tax=Capsicum baccatum TaxID=33114 RepID=A0A2G2X2U4_CAPBA|nr:hypothetical protein CQW23_06242 [Capsicum baccatum]
MESGDLDCTPSDVVISYLMHSSEKVHPTIINNDKRVSLYMMDVDADGFRPILRINVVDRPFEELLNLSPPPPRRPIVDDDLNDYENDDDHPINMEYNSIDMEYDPSDLQYMEENCRTGSQPSHSFVDGSNFYCDQIFTYNKEIKMLLEGALMRVTAIVNLLERSCSYRKYDLVKLPCEHMMAALRAKYGDGEGHLPDEGDSLACLYPWHGTDTFLTGVTGSDAQVPDRA